MKDPAQRHTQILPSGEGVGHRHVGLVHASSTAASAVGIGTQAPQEAGAVGGRSPPVDSVLSALGVRSVNCVAQGDEFPTSLSNVVIPA